MGLMNWLFGRDPAPTVAEVEEIDHEAAQQEMRREDWLHVYAAVYAEGLTGRIMSAVHSGTDLTSLGVSAHLRNLQIFAANAADEAMALADERFPLTAPEGAAKPERGGVQEAARRPSGPRLGVVRGEVKADGTIVPVGLATDAQAADEKDSKPAS